VFSSVALLGFGQQSWGHQLLLATLMTLAVSAAAFFTGIGFGILGAWAKMAHAAWARLAADAYTTVMRGIPDLLVIYLFYFGGSSAVSTLAHWLGAEGFYGLNPFMVGTLAVGIVSGAYQTEVLRGAYTAIPPGEIEAARAVGMRRGLMLRRIIGPRLLHYALPGLGNIWQQVLKESALISVTGLVELMRQVNIGAGSTGQPFVFYLAGFALYLLLTTASGGLLRAAEVRSARGQRRV
jgi:octopine/nopaline transport system permease protein